MYKRPERFSVCTILLAALLTSNSMAQPAPVNVAVGSTSQIIAQAEADLTPEGLAWAKNEARRIRSGEIKPDQVEKDAASVKDGFIPQGNSDELVLIALVNARDSQSSSQRDAGATGTASLEQTIGNVIQTLHDTQRPAPRKKTD